VLLFDIYYLIIIIHENTEYTLNVSVNSDLVVFILFKQEYIQSVLMSIVMLQMTKWVNLSMILTFLFYYFERDGRYINY